MASHGNLIDVPATHTLAGAAIAAALLPRGVIPALLAVLATAIGGVLMASWLTLVS